MDTRYWVKVAWDQLNNRGIDPTIEQVAELAIQLRNKENGEEVK